MNMFVSCEYTVVSERRRRYTLDARMNTYTSEYYRKDIQKENELYRPILFLVYWEEDSASRSRSQPRQRVA